MELMDRPCPVCGPGVPRTVFSEANIDQDQLSAFTYASRKIPELMHFRLMLCSACGILFASPTPAAGSLSTAYGEAAYDSAEEARFAARTYMRCAAGILPYLPDRAGALDIGAGDGAFLERLLEAGFTGVEGVEPSEAPIRAAGERVRPLIKKGMFHGQDYGSGRYSLVSCFQTMEHLLDPGAVCQAAMTLLKPGGAFITVAHNHRSLLARLLGEKSPIYDIEHLQLFSPESMRRLLVHRGFTGIRVFPITNTYPLHYWLKIAPLGGARKRLIELSKTTGIGYLPVPVWGGNMFAAGFKPKEG